MRARVWQIGIVTGVLFGASLATAYAQQMTTLHSFCTVGKERRCQDDSNPNGVVRDAAGNLFGVTHGGGGKAAPYGTVYEMVGGTQYQTLYTFCPYSKDGCTDGEAPAGAPIIDVAGNLYGVTVQGGSAKRGVIFELVRNGDQWTYKKLYDFCQQDQCNDGAYPSPGLTYAGASGGTPYDGSSPLYGATTVGGTQSGGVVFQLTLGQGGAWQEKVLHTFEQDDLGPSSLLLDDSGRLFGTTSSEKGNVFELTPNGDAWNFKNIYQFCSQPDCADGGYPSGPMIEDGDGALYGLTYAGGIACTNSGGNTGCGVVFKLTQHGKRWKEKVLYAFCQQADCTDGLNPSGALTIDASGNLFGTTIYGGGNDVSPNTNGGGVVFELAGGKRFRKLYSFCAADKCTDGAQPLNLSGLIITPQHSLIGDTFEGGSIGRGALYELQP